jgi:hypothetical protein
MINSLTKTELKPGMIFIVDIYRLRYKLIVLGTHNKGKHYDRQRSSNIRIHKRGDL